MRITIGSQVPVTSQFLPNPLLDATLKLEEWHLPLHPTLLQQLCVATPCPGEASGWWTIPSLDAASGVHLQCAGAQVLGRPLQIRNQAAELRDCPAHLCWHVLQTVRPLLRRSTQLSLGMALALQSASGLWGPLST